MQIDSIEIFHLALPLREPLTTRGLKFEKLETVLLKMRSGQATGWGEASPGTAPLGSDQWAAGVFVCLRDWLAPPLVGKTIDSGDQLQESLAVYHGNQFAKAALDTAWWDLSARLQDRPLHDLLGGRREAIEVGTTLDQMDSIDTLLEAIYRAMGAGLARVELKVRPGWDLEMLNAVRQQFPTETFHADIEGSMRLNHMEMLCRMDDFCLAMIEQPLPAHDLVGHAMVQDTVRTPICLDESITTVEHAEIALELKSCRRINIKPGRVGGLTPAMAIHDTARQQDVPCFVGATQQTAIGTRLGLALAAKENFTYPADYTGSEELFEQDLAPPPDSIRNEENGKKRIVLWSEPGIGVEPDGELLQKFSIARAKM